MMSHFKEYLIIKGYSRETIAGFLSVVRRFQSWLEAEQLPADSLSYNDILGYVSYLNSTGIKKITVQKYVRAVEVYYMFLQNELEMMEDNPASNVMIKGIKRRQLYDLFSEEELTELYKSYPYQSISERRNKVILGLMVYQGLHSEELSRLLPEDLKLREGKVYVCGSRRSNDRTLELRAFQVIDLQDYLYKVRPMLLELRGKASEKLFISMGEGDKLNNTLYKLLKRLKKDNIRLKNMKQLRASVITCWLKSHNLRVVQYMAGHRYVSSTEMYQLGNIEGLQADIEKYHPIG